MDKYDEAVAHLTRHPMQIGQAWRETTDHPAGCLFSYVSPKGRLNKVPPWVDHCCGCLTQVRNRDCVAWTEELTQAIQADDRIPGDVVRITAEDLPVFAEWQRRIDKELNRT